VFNNYRNHYVFVGSFEIKTLYSMVLTWLGRRNGGREHHITLPFVIGRGRTYRTIRSASVAIVIVNRRRRTDGGFAQCTTQITGSATSVGPVPPRRRGRWIFAAAIWSRPRSRRHKVLLRTRICIKIMMYVIFAVTLFR